MTKWDKLVAAMWAHPKTVRFEDLDKVLQRCGFTSDQRGSSHVVYRKPGHLLSVPKPHGGAKYVKPGYVRMALEMLEGEVGDGD